MIKRFAAIVIPVFFLFNHLSAQTRQEQSGWFFFMNTTKFNEKWGLHADVQVRSHDNWNGVRSVLIRPGLTYYIQPNQNATLGYLYTPTIPQDGATLTEHRIWEQYIISHKAFTGSLSHRFRLEQRFIEKAGDQRVFAQRLRYFFRHIQPLKRDENGFTKGPFAALQNEVFANIHNQKNTNNHFFDQNRAYIAAGYRFSKKFDAEAGYMNVFAKGATANTVNNVVQLALYTRF